MRCAVAGFVILVGLVGVGWKLHPLILIGLLMREPNPPDNLLSFIESIPKKYACLCRLVHKNDRRNTRTLSVTLRLNRQMPDIQQRTMDCTGKALTIYQNININIKR